MSNQTRLTWICIAAAAAVLSACGSPSLTPKQKATMDAAQRQVKLATEPGIAPAVSPSTPGTAAYAQAQAEVQVRRPTMRHAKQAWIGTRMVPVTYEDSLPEIFKEQRTINMDAGSSVTLATAAARLTRLTGVPVRVHSDVYATPAAGKGGSALQAPAAPQVPPTAQGVVFPPGMVLPGTPMGQAVAANAAARSKSGHPGDDPNAISAAKPITLDAVEMKWTGTLVGYLNHLTDRLGLTWEYRDGTVVIMKYVSEVHEVATLPGASKFSFGSGGTTQGTAGTGTAGTGANAVIDVHENGMMDAISSIEKVLNEMVSQVPGSSVARSDGSGRFLVKTTREMQAQVRDYIQAENSALRRQTQVQFDVYSVRTNQGDELGLDANVLFNSLAKKWGAELSSPSSLTGSTAGGASYNILKPSAGAGPINQKFGGSSAVISALASMGESVQHRPVSLIALNRTWQRTSQLKTTGYLAETTPGPASTTGVGAPGLKTASVTTGDSFAVMPQVLQDNTVLLRFGISLSDLLGLFDVTVGTGLTFQKVQTPEVTAVNQQGTVLLRPGEVMVITGLSREVSNNDRRTLGEDLPVLAGGSRKRSDQREHFIIVVRPVLI